MQLYAIDKEGRVISAPLAKKQVDYRCPECAHPVRLRLGRRRQAHFFHFSHNNRCRQSGKSQAHLQVQQKIQNSLPADESLLECRFPQIGRIADVAWIPQRLVFEVQCSPISAEEVLARNQDYQREGFQVVWILHDRRFNQWRAAAAEEVLSDLPHYFTNINADGKGIIYDQRSKYTEGIRTWRTPKYKISLSQPCGHRLGFKGDFFDSCKDKPELLHQFTQTPSKPSYFKRVLKETIKLYKACFHLILESASR